MYSSTGLGIWPFGGGKKKPSREEAKTAVKQIYLELLERDPWSPYDEGAEGFVNCLVEGWCDVDFIRTGVLESPEYRELQMRKAQQVYGGGALPGGGASGAPAAVGGAGGFSALGGFGGLGSYLPYILGGVLLISLVKKR